MPRRAVEVRRAAPDDVPALLALEAAAREDGGVDRALAPPLAEAAAERLAARLRAPDVEVHLAACGGEPVGVLALRLGELLLLGTGSAVHVEQVYVLPAWRRRGVAHQLLAAALAAGERIGAEEVTCVVPGGREVQRFFARLGFARTVVLRTAAVGRLRRGLAGDDEQGRRRATLDQIVARRRRQLDRPETPAAGLPAVARAAAGAQVRPAR